MGFSVAQTPRSKLAFFNNLSQSSGEGVHETARTASNARGRKGPSNEVHPVGGWLW
jgi:hypothetical protein